MPNATRSRRPSRKAPKKITKFAFTRQGTALWVFILVVAAIGGVWAVHYSRAATTEAQLDTARQSMYPRLIQLQHSGSANGRILATASSSGAGGGLTDRTRVFESTDSGKSFHFISEMADPQAASGHGSCCSSIFELPQQMGAQPAGTLLIGTTVGMPNTTGRQPEIRVWKSTDHGYTWSYFSSCATSVDPPADRGLWEPEFSVDSRGDLDCFFSDDTQFDTTNKTGYDQTLAMATSADGGATWDTPHNIVAVPSSGSTTYRPGMAKVVKLPNGTYFMSYEVCGANPTACIVHYRTSADGWNWGDPQDLGQIAQTPDGKHLFHSPTVAWLSGGSSNGRIALIGELVKDSAGNILNPASGSTIFVNSVNGSGSWYEMDAPVTAAFTSTPDQQTMVCNNYSSSLLPSADGSSILELLTKRQSDGTCRAFFGTGSTKGSGTATGITSGKMYRFQSVQSAQCLDVSKGSTANYGNVQQWTCNSLNPQNWTLTSKGSGYYTLKNKQSGKCLEVYKGSTSNSANVDQYTCSTASQQYWKIQSISRNYYQLVNKKSGKCLDLKSGSMTAGANVQQ